MSWWTSVVAMVASITSATTSATLTPFALADSIDSLVFLTVLLLAEFCLLGGFLCSDLFCGEPKFLTDLSKNYLLLDQLQLFRFQKLFRYALGIALGA